ncbi:MAG: penicillin acylase family protein [Chitinophagales bacterium]|nr:penicillin acylase family protein [Chitinophagales bacterium]
MIKKIIGIVLSILLFVLIYFLNKPLGEIPPLGKFLSPTHGFWQNSKPKELVNYSFELDCKNGTATIVYDSVAIPHIFADNEADLYYAQGFVVAQNRLWQMEFQTIFAAGRLSEFVGEKALELDKYNRRVGLARAAKVANDTLQKDEQSLAIATAFADGVNAYIKKLSNKKLPIEYKLLGYKPEPWSTYKSCLLMKYMAYDLTYRDYDVEYTNALRLFGSDIFKKLYPDFPLPQDPIIPVNHKWNFKAIDIPSATVTNSDSLSATLYPHPYKEFLPQKNLGSNNWAVSGKKTASGEPILCNDPHLSLNLPSIWFSMQLQTPELNVMGVTIPGAPGIIIGFNDSIAWGVTNASRDVINTYSVEYNPKNKQEYKFHGKYIPLEYEIEKYKIKGAKTVYDTIKITKAGAIVYDEHFGNIDDKKHLAIYWRAMEPSNELKTFYLLNHAQTHEDYLDALNSFGCPGQNFVYADVNNNIAIKQQGHFMLRSFENNGAFIQPLANANLDLANRQIPNNENPYVKNPERGFVSSANQKPVDQNYPYATNGYYENFRNRVINESLTNMYRIKAKDMMKLQGNNLSLSAKETLPYFLSYVDRNQFQSETAKQLLKALDVWQYNTDYDYRAPSYFYNWFDSFEQLTWDEFQSKSVSLVMPENYVLANLLAQEPNFILFDLKTTDTVETAKDIVNLAFKRTVKFFENYNENPDNSSVWQYYKKTSVEHLAMIPAFSVFNVPIGGWHNVVNATSDRWGASWRMVVDFSDGKPTAYGIYPGGQNGNPASRYYDNMIPIWAENNYYPLSFYHNKAEALKDIKE